MTADFWTVNLAALESRSDPGSRKLAGLLGNKGPGPDLGLRDRVGTTLPGFLTGSRVRSLVSTYDAAKEADRWAEDVAGGTVAVFGAAGRDAADTLARKGVRLVFWVEPRLEIWRSLFTWEDWTPWLAEDRWFPVCGNGEAWGQSLLDRYHPLWDGAFQTKEWRSAVQGAEGLWDDHRRSTLRALDSLAADTSTQARFGERWYRNTLVNLKRLRATEVAVIPGVRITVAGAGPGLEDALDDPVNQQWQENRPRTGDRLFSTDTALPALIRRGIVPDIVLCLDGQLPTYHHFVPPHPPVPLVADLASIPLLGRLGMPVVRYLSGHPFSRVIRRIFPEIPVLDGSLGNVSGLGLTAARALGASQVDAWGVDFSYRDGQTYARGTYVYDLAWRRADRLVPGESRLVAACYGTPGLERKLDAKGRVLHTTPLLRDYKQRWDEAPTEVRPVRLSHGDAGSRWEEFTSTWRNRLIDLPLPRPGIPFHSFVRGLELEYRIDWWALWPLALALNRQGIAEGDLPRCVVERALSFL